MEKVFHFQVPEYYNFVGNDKKSYFSNQSYMITLQCRHFKKSGTSILTLQLNWQAKYLPEFNISFVFSVSIFRFFFCISISFVTNLFAHILQF